jgi:filamentous hemagglutinin
VLVAGQSTGSQNGLYQVSVLGTGSDGTWIRSVDGNETGEIDAGMIVMVTEGTTYKDTQWKLTTNDPIVIGTTALTFEQNSAFAFGNIYANGTAVLADIVGDTVTFTPADNLIITANATSDTVTFAVSQSPSFTGTLGVTGNATVGNISTAGQVTATGSVTGGNLITAGLGSFGTTVSATGNITGGNLISNARIDGSNLYLSSLTANRVVFANTNGQLINSENFTFDGVTANIQGVLIVDNVEIDSNSVSSTTGNLLLETPAGSFVSVPGNLSITGNITTTGNVTGGNILTAGLISATGNITGGNLITAGLISASGNVSGNYFIGNGRQLTSVSTSFENEIHVAQNGNDTSGDGTINYPYLTIQKGVDISANPLTDRRTVVIHPGTYIENVTVTNNNTQIITYDLTGASTTVSGTLTLANNAQRLAGLKITNLTIAGNTQAYINSCTVTGQLTKSSSGYVEIVDVDMSVSGNVQITGGGTTLIDSNKIVNLRVANASASVSLRNVNQVYSPTVTAGTLSMFNCFVQASGSTANAITASAGTVLQLFNTTIYNLGLTAPARISVGGFYQLSDTQYDRANSVLGTSLGAISFFQSANIDSVTVNTTVLATGNITGGNILTGGLITATGNVTGGNILTGGLISATGNITGGNLITAGLANVGTLTVNGGSTFTGNLLPSANVTYNLGSPTQRWSEIYLAGNTIDIGGATISADLETGSLVLRGPTGAEFILTGSSPTDSFGIFGLIEAGNTSPATSTTTGALQVAGGAGIGGNIYAGGNINGPNLVAVSSGIVDGGTLRGTLLLSSGNVLANNLNANLGVFSTTIQATGNATVGNLSTAGQITVTGNITGGNLIANAQVIATGNVNGGNLVTTGQVVATGNLQTAAQIVSTVQDPTPPLAVNSSVTVNNLSVQYLDGYQRSTVAVPLSITARDTNSNVAANSVSVAERVFLTSNSAANIHFANASAITFNTNGASEGVIVSGNNLSAVGNLVSNGIVTSGNISASYFLGNVACASGIFTTKIFSGNSEVNVASAGGNVTVSVGGSPNIATFVPGGLSVPGTVSSGNLIAANLVQATTGTITGNLSVLGNLIVTGNVSYQNQSDLIISDPTIELGSPANDAPLTSNDGFSRGLKLHYYTTQDEHGFIGLAGPNYDYYQFLIDSTETNSTFTGTYANVSMGNLTATGISANAAIVATGNVTGGNLTTAGQVVAVGNISGSYFIGNGYNLTDVTTTAISVGNVSLSANATALTFSVAGNTIATVTAQGLVMGAPISMGGRKITGLASPDADGDASNKGYVDGAAGTSNFPVGDYGDLGTAATDSFGIPIAPLTTWDNEDPYGSLETTDLGVLT